jgi:hypothetical protein
MTEFIASIKTKLYLFLMRIFLFIPILSLFLSNIPIKMEKNMEDMNRECSMKQQGHCKMKEEKDIQKGCCQDKETTCVYFCCFQLVAPAINLVRINPVPVLVISSYNSYRQLHWNNPYISCPLRPPNTV